MVHVDPGSLASPYDDLTPDVLDVAIRNKHGKKEGHDLLRDAVHTRMVVLRFANPSKLDAERFDRAVSSVDPDAGQSEKTTGLLLRIRDPKFSQRLLSSPERTMQAIENAGELTKPAAIIAQSACACALLLAAPIGIADLTAVKVLVRAGDDTGRLKLVLVDRFGDLQIHEIARPYASMVDRYCRHFLPLFEADGDSLFPGDIDGHKQAAHLGDQISQHLSTEMQVTITASAIPILVGGIYLIHRPGHYDTVRRLTGRDCIESTQACYACITSDSPAKSYENEAMNQAKKYEGK